jgi:hypothetical protein
MTVRIADIIVPSVFNDYVVRRTMAQSALFRSGILSTGADFDQLASVGARTINMPFWNDLTGTDQVLSDSVPLTIKKIVADQDIAVILRRGDGWAVNDLASNLSGDDPLAAIADFVAAYWARQMQTALIDTLTGVFLAASMSGNVHNIQPVDATATADDHRFTATNFIDAVQRLGDAKDQLTAIAIHSQTEAALARLNLITFVPPSEQQAGMKQFMGRNIIVDDSLPVATVAGGINTTSYIFGTGAIAYGNGNPVGFIPTETERNALAGDDRLVNRKTYILHPRGVRFTSAAVAGSSPSNAELATATNWLRVWENKAIRIVQFRHRV